MITEFPTPPPSIAHQIQLEDRLRPAVDEFNVKPSDGIQSLLSAFSLPETPKNIAHILHIVPNLNGSQIGEFLSKQKNEEALLYFFREVDLRYPFIEALRAAFSSTLHLPAEGEHIDRILEAIATIYVEQNPETSYTKDQLYILTYATTLLNTDLHNPFVTHKMTLATFIDNVRNSLELTDIPDSFLKNIYQTIKKSPFTFKRSIEETTNIKSPQLKGFLLKKDDNWNSMYKRFFFILANNMFYAFKDDTPKNLARPSFIIQLVSVQIIGENNLEIIIQANQGCELQYMQFSSTEEILLQGKTKVYLKTSSIENRDKWLYRLQTSAFRSTFSTIANDTSSCVFDTDISEVPNSNESDHTDF